MNICSLFRTRRENFPIFSWEWDIFIAVSQRTRVVRWCLWSKYTWILSGGDLNFCRIRFKLQAISALSQSLGIILPGCNCRTYHWRWCHANERIRMRLFYFFPSTVWIFSQGTEHYGQFLCTKTTKKLYLLKRSKQCSKLSLYIGNLQHGYFSWSFLSPPKPPSFTNNISHCYSYITPETTDSNKR